MYIEILTAVTSLLSISAAVCAYYTHRWYKAALEQAAHAINSCLRSGASADASKDFANAAEASAAAATADTRMCNDFVNFILSKAAEHKLSMENFVEVSKGAAKAASVHATDAMNAALAADKHASRASESAETSYQQAVIADEHRRFAWSHAAKSEEHAVKAEEHAKTAESHATKTGEHAHSVGALSKAVADIAVQTKVRLVHRTDYNREGSNVGGQ